MQITETKNNKRPTQRVGLLLENYEKGFMKKLTHAKLNVREKST